ncbi:hypothetical protein D3C72_1587440 [compost metagenome]
MEDLARAVPGVRHDQHVDLTVLGAACADAAAAVQFDLVAAVQVGGDHLARGDVGAGARVREIEGDDEVRSVDHIGELDRHEVVRACGQRSTGDGRLTDGVRPQACPADARRV